MYIIYKISVPGVGGNQLKATLNKPSAVHWFCFKTADEFTIWLDPSLVVIPEISDCWVDNIQLIYDDVTRTTSSPPGVSTTLPPFGQPEYMEWIDPSVYTRNYDFGAYFTYIADSLVSNGYVRGRTLFGAPYDFRRGPSK